MQTVETETPFHKSTGAPCAPGEARLNGCTEFILITDHRTSKRNSVEQLDKAPHGYWMRSLCSRKTLHKLFPICTWLPKYSRQDALGDLIAGFTVGLTVIPQGLAYSGVAGLPTEYGLYGAFMGCFAYVLFGTCKDSTVGSTAIASLLVFQFAQGVWQRAVLLTFLTGIIELLMAACRLGFLVDFVSGPVSAGFTSAVAMIITTSQVRNMIGVKSQGVTFIQRWITMYNNIENAHVSDAILGVVCMCILIMMRYFGRLRLGPSDEKLRTSCQRFINKAIWFIGVTRNATVVIAFTVWAMLLEQQGQHYFRLTGAIPQGVPAISLPPFSIDAVPGNATSGIEEVKGESLLEMVQNMGSGLIIIPLIAMLENISMCKAFAKGRHIDVTQELVCQGMANIGNSLFKGYRANGGLARSAVNNASGVRTPFSNFYIGCAVVLSLWYMTDYFYFIPKAVLAALIISTVIFQLQYQVVLPMWRSKRSDLIPGFAAFFACLVFPLEIGILTAIGINLLFILYHSARPKVTLENLETNDGLKFIKLTPDRCLVFPSVEFVRSMVIKNCTKTNVPVVIDCTYVYGADFTAAKVISSMVEEFRKRKQKIIFFNLKPSVAQIFEGVNTSLVLCYNTNCLTYQLRADADVEAPPQVVVEHYKGYDNPADVLDTEKCNTASTDSASLASTVTLTKF